jgi:type II secretory pathway component PulJ
MLPHPGRVRPAGFTFIELIIAATMMSVLFLGLSAHLRGGVTVWKRATEAADRSQRERVAFERLERDAANAVVYDPRLESYGEEPGTLPRPEFSDARLRWFTVSAASARAAPAVRVVTYTCESINEVPGLWRTEQSIGEARLRAETAPRLLLPECDALSVRFAYLPQADQPEPFVWTGAWEDAHEKLPRLMAVSISLASKGREGAESRRGVTRVLAIPSGVVEKVPEAA